MEKIKGDSDLFLVDNCFQVTVKCGVCGARLLIKGRSLDCLRAMPCTSCIEHHQHTHANWVKSALADQDAVLAKEAYEEERRVENLKESIYKKFEQRFKNLMKKASLKD